RGRPQVARWTGHHPVAGGPRARRRSGLRARGRARPRRRAPAHRAGERRRGRRGALRARCRAGARLARRARGPDARLRSAWLPGALARRPARHAVRRQRAARGAGARARPRAARDRGLNPTRGLDARSTAATHRALLEARQAGAAVLLISEDLDELRALADRLVVLFGGRIVGAGRGGVLGVEAIGRLMTGSTAR